MSDIRSPSDQFFSSKNEAMLDRLLDTDFQRRTGGDLSDRQKQRLAKTVRHYMKEVQEANPAAPIQALNKEVLTAVVPDFMSYLRRTGPQEESELTMDVGKRFDRLQQDRQTGGVPPSAPDFQIPLDDSPPALSRFEEIKKQRDAEALREMEAVARHRTITGPSQDLVIVPRDSSMNQFVDSDISFKAVADAARARDQLALSQRDTRRTPVALPVPPDARQLFVGDGLPVPARNAQANPTLALASAVRDRPALPQDLIKPQDDIVSYRENEYNLYVYSGDRDWVNNSTENRYNFSVNFDPANNRPGVGYSTATNIKFKNITRIEFVKAIMPVESCDTILVSAPVSGGATFAKNTDLNTNIFSYPYLQMRIPELDTNGYGTNDGLNRSFGVISFDGYWTSDAAAKNKGFARMIPKFLKCQKVFYPTPLATLQKLTFQTQKPDGTPMCTSKDTLDVSGFTFSNDVTSTDQYFDTAGSWIWVQTPTYFNRFMVTQGDRVQFKNVVLPPANFSGAAAPGATDFLNFIMRPEGHLVSDIGCVDTVYSTGPNTVGYANAIIIKNKFADPTTGSTTPVLWGGSSGSDSAFTGALTANPGATGRFINLNHQIQIILRIITRDMDSAARLRPDNLQA